MYINQYRVQLYLAFDHAAVGIFRKGRSVPTQKTVAVGRCSRADLAAATTYRLTGATVSAQSRAAPLQRPAAYSSLRRIGPPLSARLSSGSRGQ